MAADFAKQNEVGFMELIEVSPGVFLPDYFVMQLRMTPKERALAESYIYEWIDRKIMTGAAYHDGLKEGFEEGKKEGELERKMEVARRMLDAGEPREKIMKYSKLSEEELDKLMQNL